MPADVHPVPFVADSPGDAADGVALLQDDGLDVGFLPQFVGCGESGRTGTDDDGCFQVFHGVGYRLLKRIIFRAPKFHSITMAAVRSLDIR